MTALIVLYGNTDYVQGLIGGQNILLFVCSFVGINAVCEMIASTVLTGAIGYALYRSRLFASRKYQRPGGRVRLVSSGGPGSPGRRGRACRARFHPRRR